MSVRNKVVGAVPGKGIALNRISNANKRRYAPIIENDLYETDTALCLDPFGITKDDPLYSKLDGRVCLVKEAKVPDVEWVIRGNLYGGAYEYYEPRTETGTCYYGYFLPPGLKKAEELPVPICTPTTKEDGEDQDLPTIDDQVRHVDRWLSKNPEVWPGEAIDLVEYIHAVSTALYSTARWDLRKKGIALPDTKVEVGFIKDFYGRWRLRVVDELLTPDCSRLWELGTCVPGFDPPSYDKEPTRSWYDTAKDKSSMPDEVVEANARIYREIEKIMA